MLNVLMVGAGGFIGASLRYSTSLLFGALGVHSSLATFAVNIAGCFLIGFIAEIDFKTASYIRYFLIAGILGGFTTFSAFGLDTITFIKSAAPYKAMFYAVGTTLLCLVSVYLGALSYKLCN